MNAIVGMIVEKGLSFLASLVMSYFKLEDKISKTKSKHKKQADSVDVLRAQIDAKIAAEQTVTEAEWKAFRDAVYSLNSNFY